MDNEIEWRTSPVLEMVYIILKHKFQMEVTVAIHLWSSCSYLPYKKRNFAPYITRSLPSLAEVQLPNVWQYLGFAICLGFIIITWYSWCSSFERQTHSLLWWTQIWYIKARGSLAKSSKSHGTHFIDIVRTPPGLHNFILFWDLVKNSWGPIDTRYTSMSSYW